MRVFLNVTITQRPYGGTNSFFRALTQKMVDRGVEFVGDIHDDYDVALVSTLTNKIKIDDLAYIQSRRIPVVHRKTGYEYRGSAALRERIDGVIVGDRLQIEFEPYVNHSIFQSQYSFEVFRKAGYEGQHHTIIPNGVNSAVFNLRASSRLRLGRSRARPFWNGSGTFHFMIVSWSNDARKGFTYYAEFDKELSSLPHIAVDFVGQLPIGLSFKNIRAHKPMRFARLAALLKKSHGFLAFSEAETCSNAMLEAISCGLQVIYLDSGSNEEFAAPYGIRYDGDFRQAVAHLMEGYEERARNTPENVFDIAPVADRYMEVLRQVVAGSR